MHEFFCKAIAKKKKTITAAAASRSSHGGVRLAHFLVPNPRPFFKSGVLYSSNKQSIELQNSVQNAFPMHYSWWWCWNE
jgi:hypothetical protein